MKIFLSAVAAVLLLAGAVLAASVDGKWTGQMAGRNGQTREVTFNLKSDGDKLTGTMAGPGGQEIPISDGTVSGDNASWKIKMEFNGNSVTLVYKGVVSGDEMKLTTGREGGSQTRETTLKRAK
jgi:hypothetical protein